MLRNWSIIRRSASAGAALAACGPLCFPSSHLGNNNLRRQPAACVRTPEGAAYLIPAHNLLPNGFTWRQPRQALLGFLSHPTFLMLDELDLRVLPIVPSLFSSTTGYSLGDSSASAERLTRSTVEHHFSSSSLEVLLYPLDSWHAAGGHAGLSQSYFLYVDPQPARKFNPRGWSGSPIVGQNDTSPLLQGIVVSKDLTAQGKTALVAISTCNQDLQTQITSAIANTSLFRRLLITVLATWEKTLMTFLLGFTLSAVTFGYYDKKRKSA